MRAHVFLVLALLGLAVAACSAPDAASDEMNRRTGFYGGFLGGMTLP